MALQTNGKPDLTHSTQEGVFQEFDELVGQLRGMLDNLQGRVMALTSDMQVSADIAARVANILEIDKLLPQLTEEIKEGFDLHHVNIYLVDDDRENLVLAASSGEEGRKLVREKYSIPLDDMRSIAAEVVRSGRALIANDTSDTTVFDFYDLVDGTQSKMAVPMITRGQVIGVLAVQGDTTDRFDETDIRVKTTLAEQIAVAIENADAFTRMEEARKELSQANLVVENSSTVLFRWKADEHWTVDLVSDNVDQFGYTAEELLSGEVPYAQMVHPDDLERVANEVAEYTRNGVDRFQQEYRIVSKDGTVHWTDDRTAIERDEDGNPLFYQGVVIDITDRKRVEEEVRESQNLLQNVLDNVQAQVFWKGVKGEYLFGNRSFLELTGLGTLDNLVGKTDFNLPWKKEESEFFHENDMFIVETGESRLNIEEPITLPNGETHWFLANKVPLRDASGKIIGVLGMLTDITERKEVEEEIRESQGLLQAVFNTIPARVFWKDKNLVYQGCNALFAQDAGLENPEDIVGKTDYDLFPKAEAEAFRADDTEVLTSRVGKVDIEEPQTTPEGTHWVMTSKVPLESADGNMSGVLGLYTDITERKRAQERETLAYEIGQQLNTVQDTDELLQFAVDMIASTLDYYYAHIYVYDESTKNLTVAAGLGDAGQVLLEEHHTIAYDTPRSLVATAARTLEPVVVQNVFENPSHLPNPLIPDTLSEVAIPLFIGADLLGVLDVQADQMQAFNEEELRLLNVIANQLSVALSNARQIEQTERRLRDIALANEAGRIINESVDQQEMMEDLLELVGVAMKSDTAIYTEFDERDNMWHGRAAHNIPREVIREFHAKGEEYPHGLAALANGTVVAVDNVLEYEGFPEDVRQTLNLASVIVMPFIGRSGKIGAAYFNYQQPHNFDENEITLLDTISRQVSIGIEAKRLQDEMERQLRETTFANEASRVIAAADDTETMLVELMGIMAKSLGADIAAYIDYDADTDTWQGVAAYGMTEEAVKAIRTKGSDFPHGIDAMTNKRIVAIDNAYEYENFPMDYVEAFGIQSAMAVPIIGRQGAFATVLITFNYRFHHWLDSEVSLLETISRQVSTSIEARQAQEERLRFFNMSQDMIGTASFDGYLTDLNPAWEATLGWTTEEMTSRPFLEFVHPDDIEVTNAEAAKIAEGAELLNFTNRYNTKDGDWRWLAWNATPDYERNQIYFVARDITEARVATEASRVIGEADDIEKMLTDLMEIMAQSLGADIAAYIDYDWNADTWQGVAAYGMTEEAVKAIRTKGSDFPHGIDAMTNKRIVAIDNAYEYENFPMDYVEAFGIQSAMAVPIIGQDRAFATVFITFNNRFHNWLDSEVSLLETISRQVSASIEARQAQEERLRFFNMSQDMIGTANFEGYLTDVNPAWEATLGWTTEEMTSRPFIEFVHPDDIEATNAEAAKIAEGAELLNFTNRYKTKDGDWRWLAWNATPDYERNQIYFVARDITGARAAEEQLRNLGLVVDTSPDFIAYADANNRLLFVNDGGLKLTGYSAEDVPNLTVADFHDEEGTNLVLQAGLPVVQRGEIWQHENRLKRKDGSFVIVQQTLFTFATEESDEVGLATIMQDITERKLAEDEVQQRAAQLETVAEVATQASNILELDEMLQNVVDLTKEQFDLYHAHIYLLDGDVLRLASGAGESGRRMVAAGHSIPLYSETSIVASAARSAKSVISNHVRRDATFMPNPLLPRTRAELAVPLVFNREVIGVLDVQSDVAGRFTDEDATIQGILAGQIAVAVQNAQAFEAVRQVNEETSVVAAVNAALAAAENEQDILTAMDPLFASFNVASASLNYMLDEAGSMLEIAGMRSGDGQMIPPEALPVTQMREDDFPIIELARNEIPESLVIENAEQDERIQTGRTLEFMRQMELSALFAIPILTGGQWIGILSYNFAEPQQFSNAFVQLIDRIRPTLTSAITARRSFLAEQESREESARRARELETVSQVSTATSTLLDVDTLLKEVVDLTKTAFDLYHAHVYLFNPEAEMLELAAGAGDAGEMMRANRHSIPLRHETSVVAQSARDRQGVRVDDVTASPTFLPNPLLPATRSEMALPMMVGNELIGVLDVQSELAGRFKEQDVIVKSTLAAQIAVAVQNARAYQEQQEVAERLMEVDLLKNQFLASMSHELRTPLNSIIGYSEVLLDGGDGDLTEDAHEDIEIIYTSGKHLLAIINDILDLAKIEANQMKLHKEPVNLVKILREVIKTNEVLVGERPIELRFESEIDELIVPVDELRIRQVVMNLFSNAAKFTEEGSITIELRMEDDETASVAVVDTGIGISPEGMAIVFDQFRQVDGTSTRKAGGTGLGLTITRHLVQMHGGDIHVDSVVGEGSRFWFTLPLIEREIEEVELV